LTPPLGPSTGDLGSSVPFHQISGRLLPGLRPEARPTNVEAFACRAGPPGLPERDNDPQGPPHRRRTNKKQNVRVGVPAVLAVCCLESRDCAGDALRSIAIRAMLPPRTESLTLPVKQLSEVIAGLMGRR